MGTPQKNYMILFEQACTGSKYAKNLELDLENKITGITACGTYRKVHNIQTRLLPHAKQC